MRDSLQKHDQGAGSAVYFLGFGKRHYAVTLLQPPTHLFLQHRVAALTSIPFPMHDTDAAGSGFLRGLKELHDGFPRRIHPKTVEINMVLHSPVTAAQFLQISGGRPSRQKQQPSSLCRKVRGSTSSEMEA